MNTGVAAVDITREGLGIRAAIQCCRLCERRLIKRPGLARLLPGFGMAAKGHKAWSLASRVLREPMSEAGSRLEAAIEKKRWADAAQVREGDRLTEDVKFADFLHYLLLYCPTAGDVQLLRVQLTYSLDEPDEVLAIMYLSPEDKRELSCLADSKWISLDRSGLW